MLAARRTATTGRVRKAVGGLTTVYVFQKGLNKDDRQHAHFVVGDGKNGFAKGTYAVTIDKDYKSDSENFRTAQKIANAKDTEMLNIIGPKNSVTVLQAVKIRMAVLPSCVSAA